MKLLKKILLAMCIAVIALQLVRPARNKSDQVLTTDISKIVFVPDSVQTVLRNACYDCHSNYTDYPWYSNFQPAGWLLAKHIRNGKDELNFSEFGSYSSRRQLSKLDEIENVIKDDIMPLKSYRMMHKKARLRHNEKALITAWIETTKERLPVEN